MIISMKRLTLVAHKDDEQAILKALQRISAVQIIETAKDAVPDGTLTALEERVSHMGDALKALLPYAPKRGMLEPAPESSAAELTAALPAGLKDSDTVEETVHAIARARADIEKNCTLIDQLRPWSAFPADMQTYAKSKRVRYFTGLIAASDIASLGEHSDILEYQEFNADVLRAVLVACEIADAKNVASLLKGLDWTDVAFPKLNGTPKKAIERLEDENRRLTDEKEALEHRLADMGECADTLAKAYDAAVIERDRARAAMELLRTNATFVLEGWAREDEEDKVKSAVETVTDAYYLSFRELAEDEIPPSVVKNDAFVTPFETVTNLYSRPDPNGMDPTPYMAPFYVLLFGLMLSDSGYGLVLAVGCYLYDKLKKPSGMLGGLMKVLFWGGLSTIVWGVLVGTFFGMDFDVLFGTKDVFPLLVDPMSEPIGMLILCFGLGVLHILFGVALKMKMSFQRGDWQTAIFDNFSWMLIVVGLILFGAGILKTAGMVMAIAGALMILLFKGREKKNPILRTVSGLGELYQVTSYLSDILSYARLFALGIATGVIASVFNDLCGMLMQSPNIFLKILGVIVACALLVALHAFNIGINTLGAFVHCARLQYVEFYGKFYEPGGQPFKPLGMQAKHVRLTDS